MFTIPLLEADPCAVEHAALARMRDELLLQHEGEYVVFFGDTFVLATPELNEAYRRIRAEGPASFMVERLTREPEVIHLSPLLQVG